MADVAVDPLAAGGGGGPEELLSQINDLCQQYLAMGAGTPMAEEVQALSDSINDELGGGNPDMEGAADLASEPGGEPPMEELPPIPEGGFKDFGAASKAATPALEQMNVPPEEDPMKKKSKGF